MNHQVISFVKSGVRIVGLGYLLISIPVGVMLLVIAEIIGVVEEV